MSLVHNFSFFGHVLPINTAGILPAVQISFVWWFGHVLKNRQKQECGMSSRCIFNFSFFFLPQTSGQDIFLHYLMQNYFLFQAFLLLLYCRPPWTETKELKWMQIDWYVSQPTHQCFKNLQQIFVSCFSSPTFEQSLSLLHYYTGGSEHICHSNSGAMIMSLTSIEGTWR